MTNQNAKVSNDDDLSLKDVILKLKACIKYLWEKKWIILVAALVGGTLGLAYSLRKKPVYTATTTFVLENGEKSNALGGYAGLAAMAGIDIGSGGGIFQGDNILDLYNSRRMIEKTLFSPLDPTSKVLLIDKFIEINDIRNGWKDLPHLKDIRFNITDLDRKSKAKHEKSYRAKDSIIGKIAEDINKNYLVVFKPDKKLSKIQVDVNANDEIFAKRFNEELVANVNDFYIQTKTKKSLENVAILQHKTDSVSAVMNGAIYRAAAVADATPNLNPTRQVQRIAPVQKAQFSAETNKAILSSLVQNLEMSKMALMKETPLIQTLDEPVYPLNKTSFSKTKGLLIGAFLFGALTVFYFLLKLILKNILSE